MGAGNVWLNRFATLTAVCTLFLVVAGGMVTSTGSGLAVPDWPLAYGMVFPPMVGGIFYEHGHRMVATGVGFLTTILAVWLWKRDERGWVRRLGLLAFAGVVVQGVLGGLTVLYLLPTVLSVAHACLAQTFFCLTVSLALFTSPGWRRPPDGLREVDRLPLKWPCLLTVFTVYTQLILGAVMRHSESGLAIPDFPLSFGHLVPPLSSLTVDPNAPFPLTIEEYRSRVMIHFAHRAWAVIVVASVCWTTARVFRRHRGTTGLAAPAGLLLLLVALQVPLGGAVVWSGKAPVVATAHVAMGASILATSVVLALKAWRLSAPGQRPLAFDTGVSRSVTEA